MMSLFAYKAHALSMFGVQKPKGHMRELGAGLRKKLTSNRAILFTASVDVVVAWVGLRSAAMGWRPATEYNHELFRDYFVYTPAIALLFVAAFATCMRKYWLATSFSILSAGALLMLLMNPIGGYYFNVPMAYISAINDRNVAKPRAVDYFTISRATDSQTYDISCYFAVVAHRDEFTWSHYSAWLSSHCRDYAICEGDNFKLTNGHWSFRLMPKYTLIRGC